MLFCCENFLGDSLKTLPKICVKKYSICCMIKKKNKTILDLFSQQQFFFLTQTKMEGRHNIFWLCL